MWTSTLDLDPAHVIPTKLLGLIWQGAYFSSFAPLQVQNRLRQPLPAANWVRVRNSLAGICGSDLHQVFVDGDFSIAPAAIPGHSHGYPGHEVVGEVIEVGEEVQSLHIGDRVVLRHGPCCVTAGVQPLCRSCAGGNYGLCENGSLPGPQPVGGGWSEEMLLHEQQLFAISPMLADAQAVLLEPSAVAVHAVLRRLPLAGERVLIIGAGTIGLLTLQVLRALAPDTQVHVMARHAFQVERAAVMGAKIIYPRNSYQQIARLTSARLYRGLAGNSMLMGGYDVIFDTIGSRRTTSNALRWTRAGGTVVMVGVSLHQMRVDLTPIWYQEINLIGTMGHGMENWPPGTDKQISTFEITADLIANEQIHPEELITQRYSLSDYRMALLDAKKKASNRTIKVVFDFSLQPASVVPNVRAAARKLRIPASDEARPAAGAPEVNEPVYSPPQAAHEQEETTQKVVAATRQQRYPFMPDYEPDSPPLSQQSYNAAAQYGGLPGFQPDLVQPDVPPLPEEQSQQQDFVAASEPAPAVAAEPAASADVQDSTLFPVAGAIDFQPDLEQDYAWAQFVTSPDDSGGGLEAPAPAADAIDQVESGVAGVAGVAAELPLATSSFAPETPSASAENIVVPAAEAQTTKRVRSRRKTTELTTFGRKGQNGQKGHSPPKKSTNAT